MPSCGFHFCNVDRLSARLCSSACVRGRDFAARIAEELLTCPAMVLDGVLTGDGVLALFSAIAASSAGVISSSTRAISPRRPGLGCRSFT